MDLENNMSPAEITKTLPLQTPPILKSLFDYEAQNLAGDAVSLARYRDKVILIVNIALGDKSATRELKQMNEMVLRFGGKLVVLAFPCDQFGHQNNFTTEDEILQTMKYVRPGNEFEPNFTVFEPVEVNGAKCHPVWKFLRESIPLPNDDPVSFTDPQHIIWNPVTRSDIAWNFEKFLVAPNGRAHKRFSSKFQTSALIEDIRSLALTVESDRPIGIRKCHPKPL